MNKALVSSVFCSLVATGLLCITPQSANADSEAGPSLQKGDRLALCGDSITEARLYTTDIASYLAACQPQLEIDVAQFGWGGERAYGFAERAKKSLSWFRPTVATTSYGMNDGAYQAYTDSIGNKYIKGLEDILGEFRALGVRDVWIGSPGAVDTFSFKRLDPAVYNENLARLRDHARDLAKAKNHGFADIHGTMLTTMRAAKASLGEDYLVAGADGFHPGRNGHLTMAYGFLKAFGLDGQIARIELKNDGSASASEGHRVVKSEPGRITLESSRYPFVTSQGENPSLAAKILPFLPFMDSLSRFTLVVPDLPSPRAKLIWGNATAEFSREELAAGVNLANLTNHPLTDPFERVRSAVYELQVFETFFVKSVLNSGILSAKIPASLTNDPRFLTARDELVASAVAQREKLAAAVRSTVQPVTHTIQLEPMETIPKPVAKQD